ncbi:hypothetical protein GCM10023238_26310 [Streptomyces heliomycini]
MAAHPRRVLGERIFVAEALDPDRRAHRPLRPSRRAATRRSTSKYLGTPLDAEELRTVIDRTLDAMRPVGAGHWVLSNHDVTRHATRFANPAGLGTRSVWPATASWVCGGRARRRRC